MKMNFTLFKYISRIFIFNLITIFLALSALYIIIDSLEVIKKSYQKDVPFGIIIQLVLLKLPSLIPDLAPFIILIAGMMTYGKLTKSYELIVMRAMGISIWQFLAPTVLIAFLFGVLWITILNPISSIMLLNFEKLEHKYLSNNSNLISISSSGLWLRQQTDDNETIINALKVENNENITLKEVSVFLFDSKNTIYSTLSAKSAYLEDNDLILNNVKSFKAGQKFKEYKQYKIKTDLSKEQIQETFTSPDSVSFWQLPNFIENLEGAGFSTLQHSLHYFTMLSMPFLLSSMVLIAVSFSIRMPRQGKVGIFMTTGIFIGFFIKFASDIISAISLSGSIPIIMAATFPTIISLLFGTILILHLEDG